MSYANVRGRVSAVFSAAVLALLWSGQGLAASGCLTGGATNKLCLDIASVPGDKVQPSGFAGTPTYVQYKATLRNLVLATSRYVDLDFDLAPGTGFVSVTPDPGLTCTVSGTHVDCSADKLSRHEPLTVTLVAEAPQHPTTASELVNTAVVGYQGNTTTVVHTLAIAAGSSFVPPGEEVTVVSDEETADPQQQVDAANPLWAKVTLPPQQVEYLAEINIIGDGPVNASCESGVFVSAFDGGPYLCRDSGAPRRWVQFNIGETEGAQPPVLFTAASPMQFTMMWDTSIVPADQQAPSPAFPTGAPQWAVFYAQPENTPYPDSVQSRAFADVCNALLPQPPCLVKVEEFANGDWRVSGLKQTDGSDVPTPLEQILSMLDFVLARADAGGVLPPIMN